MLIADINAVLNLGCTISTPTPAVVTESKNRARLNPATHNRALVSTAPAQLASASLTVEAPQPLITSAENAASFQDGAVAPGEVVSLSVTGLGPVTPTGFTLDRAGDIATSLEGVEVPFDGTPAPLTHVSATRITCVVPYEVHGKRSTDIRVSYQGLTSGPFSLSSVAVNPALFTANGSGAVAAVNQDGTYNSLANPAARGSTIVIFVTGEGQTSPPGVTRRVTVVSPRAVAPVSVFIGGQSASVASYGETPGLISGCCSFMCGFRRTSRPATCRSRLRSAATPQSGVTVSVRK